MKLRTLVAVAVVAVTLGGTAVAEAKKVRNPIERRLHPGRGFWADDHRPSHQPAVRTNSPSFWNWGWTPRAQTTPRIVPDTRVAPSNSWRWQRGSRAELHHPGPRKTR